MKKTISRMRSNFCVIGILWLALCAAAETESPPRAGQAQPFRLAFTPAMFTEVNEADARAAMKGWIMTVAKERNIAVDPDPQIFATLDELLAAARTNTLDGIGMVTPEFPLLNAGIKFDHLAVNETGNEITENYLLLVRQDSGIERFDQLRGRTLNVLNTPRTSLATIWLDTELLESGLPRCDEFFRQIDYNNKASRVTLPVFFRQADACLVTSNSFKVMGELNPQLAKQLRVVATSPELLPAFFAFAAQTDSPSRPQILKEMTRMKESPAGRQILTMVKADAIVEAPLSSLDGALKLLARHEHLLAGTNHLTAFEKAPTAPNTP
jgi:ABC-type phosphate/phosphonate transport system substrate-binding protein